MWIVALQHGIAEILEFGVLGMGVVAHAALDDPGIPGTGEMDDLLDLVAADVRKDTAEAVAVEEPVGAGSQAHPMGTPAHDLHHASDGTALQQLLGVDRSLHMEPLGEIGEESASRAGSGFPGSSQLGPGA